MSGNVRMRLPVAAKIALSTAGAATAIVGSPTPPQKPPEGITIEVPAQTEIWVKGTDKQRVGEVAAKIRAFRPPEPYKGKGVRYSGEKITLKEAKKA